MPTEIGRSVSGLLEVLSSRTARAAPPVPRTTEIPSTRRLGSGRTTSTGFSLASARWLITSVRAFFSIVVSHPLRLATAATTAATRSARLAKYTAHVLLGPLLARRAEQLVRARVLDELAEVHERGVVRNPVCLLEVVG